MPLSFTTPVDSAHFGYIKTSIKTKECQKQRESAHWCNGCLFGLYHVGTPKPFSCLPNPAFSFLIFGSSTCLVFCCCCCSCFWKTPERNTYLVGRSRFHRRQTPVKSHQNTTRNNPSVDLWTSLLHLTSSEGSFLFSVYLLDFSFRGSKLINDLSLTKTEHLTWTISD